MAWVSIPGLGAMSSWSGAAALWFTKARPGDYCGRYRNIVQFTSLTLDLFQDDGSSQIFYC